MGKGEREGGIRAGVGGEVLKYKDTLVLASAAVERFFSDPNIFVVDDDSGFSAIWSVC